eukprot:CAMPEP_0171312772 /NCGR_PEP_ID=MMETSP0816-20121228/30951_1 /TAXON_ID=420281 /ORGANISM="Proboscia inermis, Strain CCAP1064/1" /LENGTH=47 /DNA_ID= /DNA_START= /DNA_END= /DNA_ORIENTATION=
MDAEKPSERPVEENSADNDKAPRDTPEEGKVVLMQIAKMTPGSDIRP